MLEDRNVFIASDHIGFLMKEKLVSSFGVPDSFSGNFRFIDVGTDRADIDVDYPIYAKMVCSLVNESYGSKGILLSNTGIGMSMMANRIDGIRAALCSEPLIAVATRQNHDANVLCIPAGFTVWEAILETVKAFLGTPYNDKIMKYIRQIYMMENLEV